MGNKRENQISKLEDHLGFWLRFVSNHVSLAFTRKLELSSVTVAEWVILRQIFEFGRIVSPSEIVEVSGMTKGAISKLITRLKEKDLIICKQSKDDRRAQTIELTKNAVNLVPKLANLADCNDAEFFKCLNSAERKSLMKMLRKIACTNDITEIPTK